VLIHNINLCVGYGFANGWRGHLTRRYFAQGSVDGVFGGSINVDQGELGSQSGPSVQLVATRVQDAQRQIVRIWRGQQRLTQLCGQKAHGDFVVGKPAQQLARVESCFLIAHLQEISDRQERERERERERESVSE
jgi:hypothetical protein